MIIYDKQVQIQSTLKKINFHKFLHQITAGVGKMIFIVQSSRFQFLRLDGWY